MSKLFSLNGNSAIRSLENSPKKKVKKGSVIGYYTPLMNMKIWLPYPVLNILMKICNAA